MNIAFGARLFVVAKDMDKLNQRINQFATASRRMGLPLVHYWPQKISTTQGDVYRTTIMTGETSGLLGFTGYMAAFKLDKVFYKKLMKDPNITGFASNNGLGWRGKAGILWESLPFTFYHKGKKPSLLYRVSSPIRWALSFRHPQTRVYHIA